MRLRVVVRAMRARHRVALPAAAVIVASAGLVAFTGTVPATDVVKRIHDSVVRPASSSPSGQQFSGVAAVGALFPAGTASASTAGLSASGGHFCTASVVHSAAGNLAVTAAHCLTGASGRVVFVPGYHEGVAPYGSWLVTRVFTDSAWSASQDPDDDVAFMQLAPAPDGVPIENVTGAEHLVTGNSRRQIVQVIGYPSDADQPVRCVNWTRAFSPTQLEFDCGGYPEGTSGGPFLADVDPGSGQGSVIGVIGGYQQGGDTDAISYSIVFGSRVASLYQTASTAG